jgi:hypothetical protein
MLAQMFGAMSVIKLEVFTVFMVVYHSIADSVLSSV